MLNEKNRALFSRRFGRFFFILKQLFCTYTPSYMITTDWHINSSTMIQIRQKSAICMLWLQRNLHLMEHFLCSHSHWRRLHPVDRCEHPWFAATAHTDIRRASSPPQHFMGPYFCRYGEKHKSIVSGLYNRIWYTNCDIKFEFYDPNQKEIDGWITFKKK